MSLRLRLVVGLVLLATVGLLVADIATYGLLSHSLTDQVDDQLRSAASGPLPRAAGSDWLPPLTTNPASANGPGTSGDSDADDPAPRARRVPRGGFLPRGSLAVEVSGKTQSGVVVGYDYTAPTLRLPDTLPTHPFTVAASETGTAYRALAVAVSPPNTFIYAVPMTDVDGTLHRVFALEGIVTAAVLAAIGGIAWWVVRVGLQPLRGIEATAAAISHGDLSRRVADANERTETGRLGLALNTMLERIESAFAARAASEQRLRQFLADASHELRTPLTSIRGYAELFRRGAASRPDDLAKAMRRIEDEAARMGVLVDDLLLLARLDQGREVERRPVDLAVLAADACDDCRAADPERPVELRLDTPVGTPVPVIGDEHHLRQLVGNLLANARAHTPPHTPVLVHVGTTGEAAVFEVADQGPGLPAGSEERVFDRFFRADPARARSTGGTGLGLAIVAAIARSHGGTVRAGNRPGGGAVFTVELPLERAGGPTE